MSTSKHRFYRKVLSITRSTFRQGNLELPVTTVLFCSQDATTSRTVKTNLIGYKVYVGNRHCNGIDTWHPKMASISLKNPMDSKFFKEIGEYSINKTIQTAINEAATSYILSKPELIKNITATVRFFDKRSGEGMIHIESLNMIMPIYACNMIGKKTWYPETACMYVNEGETITFDLTGDSHQLFVNNVKNAHFDTDKWNGLDQDSLAFKCNEAGEAVNGLFAK